MGVDYGRVLNDHPVDDGSQRENERHAGFFGDSISAYTPGAGSRIDEMTRHGLKPANAALANQFDGANPPLIDYGHGDTERILKFFKKNKEDGGWKMRPLILDDQISKAVSELGQSSDIGHILYGNQSQSGELSKSTMTDSRGNQTVTTGTDSITTGKAGNVIFKQSFDEDFYRHDSGRDRYGKPYTETTSRDGMQTEYNDRSGTMSFRSDVRTPVGVGLDTEHTSQKEIFYPKHGDTLTSYTDAQGHGYWKNSTAHGNWDPQGNSFYALNDGSESMIKRADGTGQFTESGSFLGWNNGVLKW